MRGGLRSAPSSAWARVAAGSVEAAGVFQLRAQHLEEGRRHLVVLGVGRVGVVGDRMARHLAGEGGVGLGAPRRALRAVRDQQPMDRGADDGVGQRRALEGAEGGGDEAHAAAPGSCGGRGKKTEVRAW